MVKIVDKLNNNSEAMLYIGLIEELVEDVNKNHFPAIYDYYMNLEKIDKEGLTDKNLSKIEALEFFFDSKAVSFVLTSKTYKENYLKMLRQLISYKYNCVYNDKRKVELSIDRKDDCLKVIFDDVKTYSTKLEDIVHNTIENLNILDLNELELWYKNLVYLEPQIRFVLDNYFSNINLDEHYYEQLQNWENQIIVLNKSKNPSFEDGYCILDDEVVSYMNSLYTRRVQADLNRTDVEVSTVLYADNKLGLMVSKVKQKEKNNK